MVYGGILSKVSNFSVTTADGIAQKINNNFLTSAVIKLFGIPHMGLRMRVAAILKFLNLVKSDVILDAGCGMGLCLLTISKRMQQGYGVDIDVSKIKEAKRLARELNINNLKFEVLDAVGLSFADGFFDKIICSEVLEHVKEDRNLIKNFYRMLKKEGSLVISTTSLSAVNQEHKEKFEHERVGYSVEQLKSLFIDSGFSIEQILPYGVFFEQIAWKINRKLLSTPFLNILSFYPLLLFALLDKFVLSNLNANCIGYIIRLRKK